MGMTEFAAIVEGDDLHYTKDISYEAEGDAVAWPGATVAVSAAAIRTDGLRVAATSATVVDLATRRIAVEYTEGLLPAGRWILQLRVVVNGKTQTFEDAIRVKPTAFGS
jgi:hypothetical protein